MRYECPSCGYKVIQDIYRECPNCHTRGKIWTAINDDLGDPRKGIKEGNNMPELECRKHVEEIYQLAEDKVHGGHRSATIRIIDGKFATCAFAGISAVYTLDDWKFIVELGKKVVELSEEK